MLKLDETLTYVLWFRLYMIQWWIQDFPWGGVDLVGEALTPEAGTFRNFVCQNKKFWTLGGVRRERPLNPPMWLAMDLACGDSLTMVMTNCLNTYSLARVTRCGLRGLVDADKLTLNHDMVSELWMQHRTNAASSSSPGYSLILAASGVGFPKECSRSATETWYCIPLVALFYLCTFTFRYTL